MAQWYSSDFQVIQQQRQQQLGHHSSIAYGAVPHLGCFMAPPYPAIPYAYSSAPLHVNGAQHVWVPVQINCDAAAYPHFYGQMPYPQSLHPGQQIPYREVRRPAAAMSSHEGDPLQMAWPESPVTARQSFSLHHPPGPADRALPWQQGSRPAPFNWSSTAHPSHPAPAHTLRHSGQPLTPLNNQPAHLTLCDDTASSFSTAFPRRPDTAAEHHQATSESALSEGDGVSITHALHDMHLTMAPDDDEGMVDGLEPAWQWLTLGLLRDVMAQLPPHCRKRCRLVCKRWRATMDVSMQVAFNLFFMRTVDHAVLHSMLHIHSLRSRCMLLKTKSDLAASLTHVPALMVFTSQTSLPMLMEGRGSQTSWLFTHCFDLHFGLLKLCCPRNSNYLVGPCFENLHVPWLPRHCCECPVHG